MSILLAAIVFGALKPAAAQEHLSVTVSTQGRQYELGDTVTLTGKVNTLVPGEEVKIRWVKPGKTNVYGKTTPRSDGSFSATLKLDEERLTGGKWKVMATYSTARSSTTFVVQDPFFEFQMADGISGNDIFEAGERVTIEGEIYNKDRDEEFITITIMNSKGDSFASKRVKLDGREFTYSFSLEGPMLSFGEWTIDAMYPERHRSALIFNVIPSPVSVNLDKDSYLPGDTVFITGIVNGSALSSGPVRIVVITPNEQILSSVLLQLSGNGSFAYSPDITGWLASVFGSWKVVAEYGDHRGIVSFALIEPPSPVTVKTNNAELNAGEQIIISGRVAQSSPSDFVSVHIFAESGRLHKYAEARVHKNYSYAYGLVADQNLPPGSYEILVSHYGKEAGASFVVKKTVLPRDDPDITPVNATIVSDTYRLRIDDSRQYDIKYNLMSGSAIEKITIDNLAKTLSIEIDANRDGTLTIELPRELIDSVDQGVDKKYLVFRGYNNGTITSIPHDEVGTEIQRTLVVDFLQDTNQILVTGTQVVPEFSTLPSAMLIAAMLFLLATGFFVRLVQRPV